MQKAVTQHRKSMKYDISWASSASKLNEINYLTWSETVKAYLKIKDIWDVVERYNPMSSVDENDEKTVAVYKVWRKKNQKIWFNIKSFWNQMNIAFYKSETVKEL